MATSNNDIRDLTSLDKAQQSSNVNSSSSDDENDDSVFFGIRSTLPLTSLSLEDKKNDQLVIPNLIIEEDLFKSETTCLSETSAFNFPNVYNVLQCLTLKSANDNFDLERYEILGV